MANSDDDDDNNDDDGTHLDSTHLNDLEDDNDNEDSSTDPDDDDNGDDDETSTATPLLPTAQHNMSHVMESMVKVSLAGLAGTILGLSLSKKLADLRVTTAAAFTAEARRKRSSSASRLLSSRQRAHSAVVSNLPLTWGIACTVFASIIELSQLTSPSTWLLQHAVSTRLNHNNNDEDHDDDDNTSQGSFVVFDESPGIRAAITIADYTLGGTAAGIAGSFGRRQQRRQSSSVRPSLARKSIVQGGGAAGRPLLGVLPGIGLGLVAGCLQAAIDYGVSLAEEKRQQQQQQQLQQQQEQEQQRSHDQ